MRGTLLSSPFSREVRCVQKLDPIYHKLVTSPRKRKRMNVSRTFGSVLRTPRSASGTSRRTRWRWPTFFPLELHATAMCHVDHAKASKAPCCSSERSRSASALLLHGQLGAGIYDGLRGHAFCGYGWRMGCRVFLSSFQFCHAKKSRRKCSAMHFSLNCFFFSFPER